MELAAVALKRPYTVAATVILICIMGIGAALRMPIDIFPEIDIPVVSVVWTHAGMSAPDIRDRILTLHERRLASLADDISRKPRVIMADLDQQALDARGLSPSDVAAAIRQQDVISLSGDVRIGTICAAPHECAPRPARS
jgi:multidrug efflux pump subunit AcrB